jgi:hypothetical protein
MCVIRGRRSIDAVLFDRPAWAAVAVSVSTGDSVAHGFQTIHEIA